MACINLTHILGQNVCPTHLSTFRHFFPKLLHVFARDTTAHQYQISLNILQTIDDGSEAIVANLVVTQVEFSNLCNKQVVTLILSQGMCNKFR